MSQEDRSFVTSISSESPIPFYRCGHVTKAIYDLRRKTRSVNSEQASGALNVGMAPYPSIETT